MNETRKTSQVRTCDPIFSASSRPLSFSALEKIGRKDALNEPSANSFLKIFANLKARLKTSANKPAPKKED